MSASTKSLASLYSTISDAYANPSSDDARVAYAVGMKAGIAHQPSDEDIAQVLRAAGVQDTIPLDQVEAAYQKGFATIVDAFVSGLKHRKPLGGGVDNARVKWTVADKLVDVVSSKKKNTGKGERITRKHAAKVCRIGSKEVNRGDQVDAAVKICEVIQAEIDATPGTDSQVLRVAKALQSSKVTKNELVKATSVTKGADIARVERMIVDASHFYTREALESCVGKATKKRANGSASLDEPPRRRAKSSKYVEDAAEDDEDEDEDEDDEDVEDVDDSDAE